MTKYFALTILTSLLLFSCQTTDNEKVIGTWTRIRKMKDGKEIRKEDDDRMQINFSSNGEMLYLTNGNRSGIGFYSYKIVGDSIYRTNIQIDSVGKRDSIFLGSNKFFVINDTMMVETDQGVIYYNREVE